jgi:hypothetical protein
VSLVILVAAVALFASVGCGTGSGGVAGLETVSAFYQGDPTDDEKQVQVPCPSGKKAVGGGFELASGGLPIDVQFSEPMGQLGQAPTGWQAFAMETSPIGATESGASTSTPSARTRSYEPRPIHSSPPS